MRGPYLSLRSSLVAASLSGPGSSGFMPILMRAAMRFGYHFIQSMTPSEYQPSRFLGSAPTTFTNQSRESSSFRNFDGSGDRPPPLSQTNPGSHRASEISPPDPGYPRLPVGSGWRDTAWPSDCWNRVRARAETRS